MLRGIRVVLEVPVCEDKDTEPPAVPPARCQPPRATNVPLSPRPTALTGSPLAPASPAGPRSPWRPFGGRREEMQGGLLQPLPGLCPPGSRTWAQPVGSGTSVSLAGTPAGLPPPLAQPRAPGAAPRRGGGCSNPGAVTLEPRKAQPWGGLRGVPSSGSSPQLQPGAPRPPRVTRGQPGAPRGPPGWVSGVTWCRGGRE